MTNIEPGAAKVVNIFFKWIQDIWVREKLNEQNSILFEMSD